MTWENIDKTRQDESAHYSIMQLTEKDSGMEGPTPTL